MRKTQGVKNNFQVLITQMSILKIIWLIFCFSKEQLGKSLWHAICNFCKCLYLLLFDWFPLSPAPLALVKVTLNSRVCCYLTTPVRPHGVKQAAFFSPWHSSHALRCAQFYKPLPKSKISKPSYLQDEIKFPWRMKGAAFSKITSLNFILSNFLPGSCGVLLKLSDQIN